MKKLLLVAVWAWCVAAVGADIPRLNLLLISGQNNHDWKTTTPKLKSLLESSGRFAVQVVDRFDKIDPSELSRYDVLLSNWNTWGENAEVKDWPAAVKEAFLRFVREGRGLVVVHAGSSSFYDWPEYQQLTGAAWGKDTGHGPIHEFSVSITDTNHPITRGLSGFKTTDELWHRTAFQPGNHVLVSAFSAKDRAGSGNDEPIAFVRQFGKGRCFTLLLGHDAKAMESAGFSALLCRGAEWAATEKVTLPPK